MAQETTTGSTRVGEWTVTPVELLRARRDAVGFTDLDFALNALLLARDGQLVLVDAGSGPMGPVFLRETGVDLVTDLERSLAVHGVRPSDIDLVIATHFDCDHVGGALEGTWPDDVRPAFGDTPVVATEVEVEAARDTTALRRSGAGPVGAATLAPVLRLVADGDEVAPGVRMHLAPGHTPGHAMVEIDGDPPLVFAADVFHAVEQLPVLGHSRGDQDPDVGLATRRRVLAELAARDVLVLAAHVPGPEPGRIVADGEGYRWETAGRG